jgi:S-adenosyl methyltransferase
MTDEWFAPADPDRAPVELDITVAHPARIYDYWLGGKDNYPSDREAAEQAMAAMPFIVSAARANRAFLGRVVRFLAGECGVRQFLDIGTGLPSGRNVHQVAQDTAPRSRIVYVDNDPIVLAHARALLTSSPEGATSYISADLRDTGKILTEAAETLDFSQPMAVMLLMILQFIPDSADPYEIVATLMKAVPSGSYLAISHAPSDIEAEAVAEGTERYNERSSAGMTNRTHAEVSRFFDGLDMIEPGLVQLHKWRPAPDDPPTPISGWAGVAQKP